MTNKTFQERLADNASEFDSIVMEMVTELDYWQRRCLAAESFISSHVCDPDMTDDMVNAYYIWKDIKSKEIKK